MIKSDHMKISFLKTYIKKSLPLVAVGVLVVAIVSGSYYLGFIRGEKETRNIIVEGAKGVGDSDAADFSTFWNAWNIIKSRYVSTDAIEKNSDLVYGAISGLVNSLGDPHSIFFPPKEANKFQEEISGQFSGIGAEIGFNADKQIIIIAPIKDTPAYRAGVKAGDVILEINKESTSGLAVDEAVKRIRGERGTKVVLKILREGWKDSKDFEIIRDTIQVPTLDFQMVNDDGVKSDDGKIAYIKIYNFYDKAPTLFYQAALKAVMSKSKAIIVDVRNNPGGYLDAAVNISGWFVDKDKAIVTEEFRDKSKNETFYSAGPSLFKDIPIVVLINKGSASASEILAGALKDDNGATIIGEKSFGKGTVQELVSLPDTSMIKITVAHWITPAGHMIDKNGITPDIEVKENQDKEEDSTSTPKSGYENDIENDSVFQKAIEVIREKISI